MKFFSNFQLDEAGAVTVDWVVLTAAIVGLGFAILSTLAPGANNVGDHTAEALGEIKTRVGNGTVLD